MSLFQIIIVLVAGYLIGSLPSAYVVTLIVKRINIFEVGSGNMGGTNVARTLGLGWGIFTSVLDASKGLIAVVVAQLIMGETISIMPVMSTGLSENLLIPSAVAAVAAVAGHNWSLFATLLYTYYQKTFAIRGGKGAATAFGSMIAILPIFPNALLLAVGVSIALITRYASLSVLVSFSTAFIWVIVWSAMGDGISNLHIIYVTLLAVLIIWRFRENVERLATGTERRLGERVQS